MPDKDSENGEVPRGNERNSTEHKKPEWPIRKQLFQHIEFGIQGRCTIFTDPETLKP